MALALIGGAVAASSVYNWFTSSSYEAQGRLETIKWQVAQTEVETYKLKYAIKEKELMMQQGEIYMQQMWISFYWSMAILTAIVGLLGLLIFYICYSKRKAKAEEAQKALREIELRELEEKRRIKEIELQTEIEKNRKEKLELEAHKIQLETEKMNLEIKNRQEKMELEAHNIQLETEKLNLEMQLLARSNYMQSINARRCAVRTMPRKRITSSTLRYN